MLAVSSGGMMGVLRLINRRWCSDGFEIGCDNGERVRVAFALDCCDREAMSFLATTGGISGDDVRDLMVAAVDSAGSIGCRPPSNGCQTTVAATSLAIHADSLATSV
jgi:transposase InsO family protein